MLDIITVFIKAAAFYQTINSFVQCIKIQVSL